MMGIGNRLGRRNQKALPAKSAQQRHDAARPHKLMQPVAAQKVPSYLGVKPAMAKDVAARNVHNVVKPAVPSDKARQLMAARKVNRLVRRKVLVMRPPAP